MISIRPD